MSRSGFIGLSESQIEAFDDELESSKIISELVKATTPLDNVDLAESLMRSFVRARIRECWEEYRILFSLYWAIEGPAAEEEFVGHISECIETRPWPSTSIIAGQTASDPLKDMAKDSPLSRVDYHVGKTSHLTAQQRFNKLVRLYKMPLTDPIFKGFPEFGRENSSDRLMAIANKIASHIRLRKRNDREKYRYAILDWQTDLDKLKKKFHRSGLPPWPGT